MRIAGRVDIAPVSPMAPTAPSVAVPPAVAAAPAPGAAAVAAPLQTAVIQPALAALRAMPDDIDHARVAALRDAIARGEVTFDAARLAGFIQRFHAGTP